MLSCTTCKAFEPLEDSDGRMVRGKCHRYAPVPQLQRSGDDFNIVEVIFPTLYLPNFCLEHIQADNILPLPPRL
jgi:hypothetical protein